MGSLLPLSPRVELEQAEKLRRTSIGTDFERSVLLEHEVMDLNIPKTKFLLNNFITEKSINLVNGFRGMGKSWFVEMAANGITWGDSVGPWKVGKSVHTLLVDGEMPMSLLQERIKRMNRFRDIRFKESLLFIYPESYAYRIGLKRANLLDAKWRQSITEVIEKHNIELLILDNLSSLAPGIDENTTLDFNPINRWMLELRFIGCSIILTHHTGKSGEQRGTTAHEDHVDTSIMLNRPAGYLPSDGCKFICKIIKDRSHLTEGKQYTLQLCENEKGYLEFETVMDTGIEEACKLLGDNADITQTEAIEFGISRMTFQRAKERLGLKKRKYERRTDEN